MTTKCSCGYSRLSWFLFQVFEGLIAASQVSNDPGKFAESRRDALNSLARYVRNVSF